MPRTREKPYRPVHARCYRHRITPTTQTREERAVTESTAQIKRRTAMHRLCPGVLMSGTRLARARFAA